MTIVRAGTFLGTPSGAPMVWVLIAVLAATVTGGLLFGVALRRAHPTAYTSLGAGALLEPARASVVVIDAPAPATPAPMPRPGYRWRPLRWLRALVTVARLWPLWRRVQLVLPQVTLPPRYRGPAALRSLARHAPLAAVRMPVEILDAYAVLADHVPPEAFAVARAEAARLPLRAKDRPVHVEAALLAVALQAGTGPPARAPYGAGQSLLSTDLAAAATVPHLIRVGRALRRSSVVRATLRAVPSPAADR